MKVTRVSESFVYSAKRQALQEAERQLVQQRETVAALRRDLPQDTVVGDYEFLDLDSTVVSLASLVHDQPLIIYHLMYGKAQTVPCPMCSMWIDGFNATHNHVVEHADFAIVSAADPESVKELIATKGWDTIPVFSAGESSFKYDFGSEDEEGNQIPTISVFVRQGDDIIHTYSGQPMLSEDMNQRGLDLLSPVWNLLDLLPAGRGDWYPG